MRLLLFGALDSFTNAMDRSLLRTSSDNLPQLTFVNINKQESLGALSILVDDNFIEIVKHCLDDDNTLLAKRVETFKALCLTSKALHNITNANAELIKLLCLKNKLSEYISHSHRPRVPSICGGIPEEFFHEYDNHIKGLTEAVTVPSSKFSCMLHKVFLASAQELSNDRLRKRIIAFLKSHHKCTHCMID